MVAVAALLLGVAVVFAQPSRGSKTPALEIRDTAGKAFSLKEELKKGPVFVSFWGSWCAPCRDEFPLVSRMAKSWQPKGVAFVSVAVWDKDSQVRSFIRKNKPAQRVAVDVNKKVFTAWDLDAVPANFLIGRDGKVLAFYDQFETSDIPAIEKDLKQALKAYGK